MISVRALQRLLFTGAAACIAGCGVLPSSGPSAGALRDSEAVALVRVTPEQARALAADVARRQTATLDEALKSLATASALHPLLLAPGDVFHLTMFTLAPWAGDGLGTGDANLPRAVDLGNYAVSSQGTTVIPYIGTVSVAGLDPADAQAAIAARFASAGVMQDPSAKIDLDPNPRSGIIVTGALGAPRLVPWNPGGITLADAITRALGDGAAVLGSEGDTARAAIRVAVFRGDASVATLPVQAALEHTVELMPGDRVVVTHEPAVRVTVLGGGVARNGIYDYAQSPTLATVLAQASGLDTNIANDRAVFVLQQAGSGQRPVLYDFAWNRTDGLIASQTFPLQDGDLVYVDEALIVPLQKVVDTLLGVAAVANVAK